MSDENDDVPRQSSLPDKDVERNAQVERRWFQEINAVAGFDEPWVLPGPKRCFLCGIVLSQATRTVEHLLPKWFIKQYDLDAHVGQGRNKRFIHPFRFTSDWEVPYESW